MTGSPIPPGIKQNRNESGEGLRSVRDLQSGAPLSLMQVMVESYRHEHRKGDHG
ncbi:hypothetical protein [Crocosphaera sp. Alani8]|uniref:hypothetical protein n=1 Tax=Crocosphaera sp. Alani8 TaxID=3038952 RepID=UPI00313C81EF